MFEIETKNLKISEELNRKIDMICKFDCVKYEFISGNIKSIKNINISYSTSKEISLKCDILYVHIQINYHFYMFLQH